MRLLLDGLDMFGKYGGIFCFVFLDLGRGTVLRVFEIVGGFVIKGNAVVEDMVVLFNFWLIVGCSCFCLI